MRYDQFMLFCGIALLLQCCSSPKNEKDTTRDNAIKNTKKPHQHWKGTLNIKNDLDLPFLLQSDERGDFKILNDAETLVLQQEKKGDSLMLHFPAYSNYLIVHSSKRELKGYFVQPDRSSHRRIPFEAIPIKDSAIWNDTNASNSAIEGQWNTVFETGSPDEYPAIGQFDQSNNGKLTGTFMTETGDYRYLQGALDEDSLTLATFDGAHAFLFTATLSNDTLSGKFYSGSHWETEWMATKNDSTALRDPEELTYMTSDKMELSFLTTDSSLFQYPNDSLRGQVIMFQILGTWCPNCLDETEFYKKLYADYREKGLEIIGIGYEYPDNFQQQAARIERFRMNKSVPYPILVGGKASKEKASTDFEMLNTISSFPTTLFIDRHGNVARIHTGFNGPGTGEVYEKYKRETRSFIEELLGK
ncbi:MAG: TlpA disulfide reductase family protein [Bacteroidota bacterium]